MSLVALDLSPLTSGHAGRGVGTYTRLLYQALQEQHKVSVTDLETSRLGKIDLIHYPYFDLFFPTLSLLKHQPSIVTIHDVIPLLFPQAYPKGMRGWLALIKQRLALQSVAAIITDSQAAKDDIHSHLRIKKDRIHVVYLAANPLLVKQSPTKITEIKQKYSLPEKYCLYVGDINYNKNLPQLIKSLKFLPDDLHLVCVGKHFKPQHIPEWQAIERQVALSNVAKRVTYITDLAPEQPDDLASIYTGAVCYVQPSLAEGFGLPVLEAMQCQTPVVSSKNSSLIEVVGTHGILTQTDAESLADGMRTVLNWTQRQREKMIQEAFRWSQTFSWTKVAQETAAVYLQVLKASQLRKSL